MSLKTKSAHAILWTIVTQISLAAITFGVDISITRILDPADFGLIGMIVFFMTIGQTLIDNGMTSSLIRTKDPDHIDYATVFFVNVGVSLALYGLFFFCAPFISEFYHQPALTPIIRIYLLGLVMGAFAATRQARLTKEMDFKTLAKIQIVAKAVSGIAGIYFAYSAFGVWSLVYMYLIYQALLVVQYWIYTPWHRVFFFNIERLKYHFAFGYKLSLSALLESVFGNIYYLIIGKFFSSAVLGYFAKASQLQQMPVNAISGALSTTTFPLFSSIQEDERKLKIAYTKLMQQVIFWIAPLLMGAAVLAEIIFEILFTAKWLPAVPYFQLLCIGGVLFPINSYNLNILKIFGRSDLFLKAEVMKKILIVAMIAIALPYGIFALLAGQVLTSILGFIINSYYSSRFIAYSTKNQIRDCAPILLLALAMSVGVWVLNYSLPNNTPNISRLAICIISGSLIYFAMVKYFKIEAYNDFITMAKGVRISGEKRNMPV